MSLFLPLLRRIDRAEVTLSRLFVFLKSLQNNAKKNASLIVFTEAVIRLNHCLQLNKLDTVHDHAHQLNNHTLFASLHQVLRLNPEVGLIFSFEYVSIPGKLLRRDLMHLK